MNMNTLNQAKGDTATAVINYPNQTTVTIKGDLKIVKQIMDQLSNKTIEYTAPSFTKSEN